MAKSYNGWKILKSRPSVKRPGPHRYSTEGGYRHFASHDVADVLAWCMWQEHVRVELVTHWDGWRPLGEAGAALTNHASGTATDTNWLTRPWERRFPGGKGFWYNLTSKQVAELRKIWSNCRDSSGRLIIRSGFDFAPGGRDIMHIEIAYTLSNYRQGHVTPATVKFVADKLRKSFRPPRTFDEIKAYQRTVGVTADGKHGPATISAIKRYQKARNVSQTGLWDEATKKAKLPTPIPPKEDPPMSAAEVKEIKDHIDLLRRERTNAHVKEMEAISQVASDVLRYKNENLAGDRDVYSLLRGAATAERNSEILNQILAAIEKGGPDTAEVVRDIFSRSSQGFSTDYWMRNGQVDSEHRAFPADKFSQMDMLLRIAAAVGVKEYGVYTAKEGPVALEQQGDSFIRSTPVRKGNENG